MSKKIGLISGSGQFPIIFADAARKNGFAVYAAAYLKEADPELEQHVDAIDWFYVGQIKKLIRFFKDNHITEAVMMGAINKTRLFKDVKPDIKALSMIATMRSTHDDGILRAFASALEDEGIHIKPSTFLLPELLAPAGVWTRAKPSRAQKKDVALGWRIAKEIGRLDIGQCVVVARGSVMAVEAIDGTDATIDRGGSIGNGEAVLVKVCKPNQDTRFDIPAVGAGTIRRMAAAGIRTLAIEAGRAVVFDKSEMINLADEAGICIVGLASEPE
ncbi:MAG: UDP-2,3-diacylglucosamine diphosphatase LpxI [Desulfobacteraceae bacterium]|nr:UDP-2,3-diacylglucosamine diphosphatase LpxI [Desulfobacteraceae bacterium]